MAMTQDGDHCSCFVTSNVEPLGSAKRTLLVERQILGGGQNSPGPFRGQILSVLNRRVLLPDYYFTLKLPVGWSTIFSKKKKKDLSVLS